MDSTDIISDQFIFLLSTDWFSTRHADLSLYKGESDKTIFKDSARDAVNNLLLRESNYFNASFEKARIEITRNNFFHSCKSNVSRSNYGPFCNFFKKLLLLQQEELNILWEFKLTIQKHSVAPLLPSLDIPLETTNANILFKHSNELINFENSNNSFFTKWDMDLQGKFDEIDCYIQDFFTAQVAGYMTFNYLICLVSKDEDRKGFFEWIADNAKRSGLLKVNSIALEKIYLKTR